MNVNERIKFLRKELGLTQNEFGEKVGLKKSAVSQIENGSTSANPRIIQLICNAYGVSEKWLVTGKGKMYDSDEDAIIEKVTRMFNLTPEQEIFARHWLELPPDAREAVVEYVVNVVESIKENQDAKKDGPLDPPEPGTDSTPAEMPTFCQPFANPVPTSCQPSANSMPATQPDEPADDGRHDITVNDEELALVLSRRQQEKRESSAYSSTNPIRA